MSARLLWWARCLSTGAIFLFAGCPASSGPSSGPDREQAPSEEAVCGLLGSLDRLPLIGMEDSERRSLFAKAKDGLVVLSLHEGHCSTRLDVLSDCHIAGGYSYSRAPERDAIWAQAPNDLAERMPLLRLPPASWKGSRSASVRLDLDRTGLLRASSERRWHRAMLVGAGCESATHVAAEIDLGGWILSTGPRESLEATNDSSERKKTGATELVRLGVLDRCRTGRLMSGSSLPEDVCGEPVRTTLVAIEEPAPLEEQMVSLPGGTFPFRTNDPSEASSRRDVHLEPFWIDRYEVTAGDYARCVEAGGCKAADASRSACTAGVPSRSSHPINCVTWAQAREYCQFAGKRLPSEVEWEYAARGSDARGFEWGNAWPPPEGVGNFADVATLDLHPEWTVVPGYRDGYAETSPVGALPRAVSVWGVFDLTGNVLEWTLDAADTKAQGPKHRVVRGASFGQSRRDRLKVTHRSLYREDLSSIHIGFRCAADAQTSAAASSRQDPPDAKPSPSRPKQVPEPGRAP